MSYFQVWVEINCQTLLHEAKISLTVHVQMDSVGYWAGDVVV